MSEKTFLHLNHLMVVVVDESVVPVHLDDGLDVVEDKVFFHCFSTEQWLQTGYMTGQNFVPGENMKKNSHDLWKSALVSHSRKFSVRLSSSSCVQPTRNNSCPNR